MSLMGSSSPTLRLMALAPVRLHSTDASKDALRPPITRVDVRYAPDSGGKADIAGGPDGSDLVARLGDRRGEAGRPQILEGSCASVRCDRADFIPLVAWLANG